MKISENNIIFTHSSTHAFTLVMESILDFGDVVIPAAVVTAPVSDVTPTTPMAPVAPVVPQRDIRQIVSGISMYFPEPAVLVGKTCMFVTNLEPRKIKGLESNGMLFALSTKEGAFSLLEPNNIIPPGTRAY